MSAMSDSMKTARMPFADPADEATEDEFETIGYVDLQDSDLRNVALFRSHLVQRIADRILGTPGILDDLRALKT